jgi:hypothetical protein
MIELQTAIEQPTGLSHAQCSICGNAMRVTPLKITDADVVCRDCRCRHCSIPLSSKACRCGTAHGTPSKVQGLCERCYLVTNAVRQVPSVEIDDDDLDMDDMVFVAGYADQWENEPATAS